MPPAVTIGLALHALLFTAGGATLTLYGAAGVACGREVFDGGARVLCAALGAIGLVIFIIGAACLARLLV
jgi:hypothetical protein